MLKIYHNPRCSKSRAALQYLESKNIQPEIVLYIKDGLNQEQVRSLLKKLNLTAQEFLRKKEKEYTQYGLAEAQEEDIIAKICEYPNLFERPVIESEKGAVIARPIENLYDFLEEKND